MIVAVPKETEARERRVALSPEGVSQLVKMGCTVYVETEAGTASAYVDEQYKNQGAEIKKNFKDTVSTADLVLKVAVPSKDEIAGLKEGAVLISFLWALTNKETVDQLKAAKVTALGMEAIPRISRAQKMDALSSMSSIAGYKAVLLGANELGKYMPMLITAAGTVAPAKCLILGAGVAGLQAIATARRLGAVVEAFDVRPAVKEQVESLGAKFVEVELDEDTETKGGYAKELSEESKKRQKEAIHKHVKASDVVITTALIPGKKAPILITKEMVADMKPGSVVVDLAAEQGGNCELTKPGETSIENHVHVMGPLNIPSMLPFHASQLYSKNIMALLGLMIKEGKIELNFDDEIIKEATITHGGEIVSPRLTQ